MSSPQHDADIKRVAGEQELLSKIAKDFDFKLETVRTCAMRIREVQKDWWMKYGRYWREQNLGPREDVLRLARALHRIKKGLTTGEVPNRLHLALARTPTAAAQCKQDLDGLDRIASLLNLSATLVGERLGRARYDWRLMELHPRALLEAKHAWICRHPKRGSRGSSTDLVFEILSVVDPSFRLSSVDNLRRELKNKEDFGLKNLNATYQMHLDEYRSELERSTTVERRD